MFSVEAGLPLTAEAAALVRALLAPPSELGSSHEYGPSSTNEHSTPLPIETAADRARRESVITSVANSTPLSPDDASWFRETLLRPRRLVLDEVDDDDRRLSGRLTSNEPVSSSGMPSSSLLSSSYRSGNSTNDRAPTSSTTNATNASPSIHPSEIFLARPSYAASAVTLLEGRTGVEYNESGIPRDILAQEEEENDGRTDQADSLSPLNLIRPHSIISTLPITITTLARSFCAYYEILVIYKHPRTTLSFGLVTLPFPENAMPGWAGTSVAMLSDGSRIHCANGSCTRSNFVGKGVRAGDTVGCGYIPAVGGVFFTLNGEFLGEAFSLSDESGEGALDSGANGQEIESALTIPFHAGIGSDGPAVLNCNFGGGEFVYEAANLLPSDTGSAIPATSSTLTAQTRQDQIEPIENARQPDSGDDMIPLDHEYEESLNSGSSIYSTARLQRELHAQTRLSSVSSRLSRLSAEVPKFSIAASAPEPLPTPSATGSTSALAASGPNLGPLGSFSPPSDSLAMTGHAMISNTGQLPPSLGQPGTGLWIGSKAWLKRKVDRSISTTQPNENFGRALSSSSGGSFSVLSTSPAHPVSLAPAAAPPTAPQPVLQMDVLLTGFVPQPSAALSKPTPAMDLRRPPPTNPIRQNSLPIEAFPHHSITRRQPAFPSVSQTAAFLPTAKAAAVSSSDADPPRTSSRMNALTGSTAGKIPLSALALHRTASDVAVNSSSFASSSYAGRRRKELPNPPQTTTPHPSFLQKPVLAPLNSLGSFSDQSLSEPHLHRAGVVGNSGFPLLGRLNQEPPPIFAPLKPGTEMEGRHLRRASIASSSAVAESVGDLFGFYQDPLP